MADRIDIADVVDITDPPMVEGVTLTCRPSRVETRENGLPERLWVCQSPSGGRVYLMVSSILTDDADTLANADLAPLSGDRVVIAQH